MVQVWTAENKSADFFRKNDIIKKKLTVFQKQQNSFLNFCFFQKQQ